MYIYSFIVLILLFQSVSAGQAAYKTVAGITLLEVPAGEFMMGTADVDEVVLELPEGNAETIRDETPLHRVRFQKSFYLSRTEVTQFQWYQLMQTKPGPEKRWVDENWQTLPVTGVSWFRAQDFINALNNRNTRFKFRLPTEAQWEYAARAGSKGVRPYDVEELEKYAWFIDSSGDKPHPVATKPANAWGFYDMLGNAWEWVGDWYDGDYYANSPLDNPQGANSGKGRIRRGGSFHCPPHLVRSAFRSPDLPSMRYEVLGFRLAADKRLSYEKN